MLYMMDPELGYPMNTKSRLVTDLVSNRISLTSNEHHIRIVKTLEYYGMSAE